MRKPMRLRRKFVRFSGGSASRRRIRSRSARSVSLLSACRRAFLPTRGFFKNFLQNRQHGDIAGTAAFLLLMISASLTITLRGGRTTDGLRPGADLTDNCTHAVDRSKIILPDSGGGGCRCGPRAYGRDTAEYRVRAGRRSGLGRSALLQSQIGGAHA